MLLPSLVIVVVVGAGFENQVVGALTLGVFAQVAPQMVLPHPALFAGRSPSSAPPARPRFDGPVDRGASQF